MYLSVCSEIGKASPMVKDGAVIGYGGRAIEVNKNRKIHTSTFLS